MNSDSLMPKLAYGFTAFILFCGAVSFFLIGFVENHTKNGLLLALGIVGIYFLFTSICMMVSNKIGRPLGIAALILMLICRLGFLVYILGEMNLPAGVVGFLIGEFISFVMFWILLLLGVLTYKKDSF